MTEEFKQSNLRCQVDDSPLKESINRNKESLRVKLMLRRPYNQLVAQGIMPPLKTPPSFHDQNKQQERRKTGDLLKAKIQQRPKREELVRQHILEDVGHIDPSLAERQRMLKKAKLADQLNDQLSHRPGPLELIQKNILHTEEPIERAIKEGHISFKATCEGQSTKPQHPDHYISFEDESQSSGGTLSPLLETSKTSISCTSSSTAITSKNLITLKIDTSNDAPETPNPNCIEITNAKSLNKNITKISLSSNKGSDDIYQDSKLKPSDQKFDESTESNIEVETGALVTRFEHKKRQQITVKTITRNSSQPSPIFVSSTLDTNSISLASENSFSPVAKLLTSSSAVPCITATSYSNSQSDVSASISNQTRTDAPGKDKNRKKTKTKNQPKTKTIKFHEYKGPPNAQKLGVSSLSPNSSQNNETSYELLLQQQQLFLQWQVEFKNKFPQLILPATTKSSSLAQNLVSESTDISRLITSNSVSSKCSNHTSDQPPLRPLGKLEDMKVSDLKVELKRRCLPVSGSKPQLIERLKPFTEIPRLNLPNPNNQHDSQRSHIILNSPILDVANKSITTEKEKFAVTSEINLSHQSALEKSSISSVNFTGNLLQYRKKMTELHRELDKIHSQQNQTGRSEKLALQQHLQNKLHQQHLTQQLHQLQQIQQQQNHELAIQQINSKANLAAILQTQSNNMTVLDATSLTAVNNKKNKNNKSGQNTTAVQVPAAIVLNLAKPAKLNGSILSAIVAQAQNQQLLTSSGEIKSSVHKHDEVAKLLKVKIEPIQKNSIKSQMVDDVLEILISSGELSPSAAHEPVTPTIPNNQIASTMVQSAEADSPTQSTDFTAVSSPMELSQNSCDSHISKSKTFSQPKLVTCLTVELPGEIQQQPSQKNGKTPNYTVKLLSSETDFEAKILMNSLARQTNSSDPQPPQEVTSTDNINLDLKDIELDLDSMDFCQLDCDFGVKMEPHHGLIDIGAMPMDMDESDWLESLTPQPPLSITSASIVASNGQHKNNLFSQKISDPFDPLLANNQDAFDPFNIEESELKISSGIPSPWNNDQIDFCT